MPSALGLFHVYTGAGKGKTTAAWGLAVRAVGRNLRVKVLEFLKCPRVTGEGRAARRLGISVETFGVGFYRAHGKKAPAAHRLAARKALRRAAELLASGRWDLVILDEAATAASLKLIATADLLRALRARSRGVEAVVTGRGAPASLRRAADYLTDMRAVRHPFEKGVKARRGIEF